MEQLQVGEDFWSSLTRDFETDQEGGITYEEFKRNMLALLEHNTPQSAQIEDSDIMSDDSAEEVTEFGDQNL